MNKKLTGGIHPAVAAVWAAVIASVHILPTFPILGTGGTFSISSVLIPLSGIFFGPIAGALCSAVGCFLGSLIAPFTAWVGLGTFIIGTTTAFTTGCIAWGKWPPFAVSGILVYIVGTVLWFTQEIGRGIIIYPLVYYGLGFISLIAGIILAPRFFSGSKRFLKFLAIWLCAFGGLIGGATVGNFFSLVLYKLPEEFWATMIIISPVERAIFATGAMLVGAPLMSGLSKIGIYVGPQSEEEFADNTDNDEQEIND